MVPSSVRDSDYELLIAGRAIKHAPASVVGCSAGAATARSRGGLILLYHRLTRPAVDPWGLSVSPERFSEQLSVLRRRAKPFRSRGLVSSLQTGEPTSAKARGGHLRRRLCR